MLSIRLQFMCFPKRLGEPPSHDITKRPHIATPSLPNSSCLLSEFDSTLAADVVRRLDAVVTQQRRALTMLKWLLAKGADGANAATREGTEGEDAKSSSAFDGAFTL